MCVRVFCLLVSSGAGRARPCWREAVARKKKSPTRDKRLLSSCFFFLLDQNVEALYQSIGEVFSESVVIFFGPFTLSRQTTRKKSYNAYFGRK